MYSFSGSFPKATQCSLDFLEPVFTAADENWSFPKTLFRCSSLLLMTKPVALSLGCWTGFRAKPFYSSSFLMHDVQIENYQHLIITVAVSMIRGFEILSFSLLHSSS